MIGKTSADTPSADVVTRLPGARHLLLLTVAVVAVIMATAALTARSLGMLVSAQDALTRTIAFDKSLLALQAHLLDAETGQRGYLLTGRIDYLQPYFSALRDLQQEPALAGPAQDDAETAPLRQRLRAAIDAKLQEMQRTLRLHDEGRTQEALALVKTDAGKQAMDAVRAAVDAMIQREDQLTTLRRAEYGREVRNTYVVFGTSMLMNLLLLVLLVQRVRAHNAAALRARDEMQLRNAELAALLDATTVHNAQVQALGVLAGFLQSAANIEEAVDLLQGRLPALMQAPAGALYLMAASRNQLRRTCAWGAPDWAESLEPVDCWGLRRGQPVRHAADAPGGVCPHFHLAPAAGLAHAAECLPLVAHGDLIGLLVLSGRTRLPGEDAGSERHQQMVLEQVALSVGNLRLRESLRQQSIRDVLTGLYNRRFLEESVQRELRRAERSSDRGSYPGLALLMIDVDHFKRFNDQHGHDVGDQVLREVAQSLQRNTRGSDVAARHGGEEFVVVLPDAAPPAALQRAEQLRQDVQQLVLRGAVGQVLGPVTVSVGVALYPDDGVTLETLLQAADKALYEAKRRGRNQVVAATVSTAGAAGG